MTDFPVGDSCLQLFTITGLFPFKTKILHHICTTQIVLQFGPMSNLAKLSILHNNSVLAYMELI